MERLTARPGFCQFCRLLAGLMTGGVPSGVGSGRDPDRFGAEGGEAHYHKALALAEPRGMRPLIAPTATSASASSTGARVSNRRPGSTSPP